MTRTTRQKLLALVVLTAAVSGFLVLREPPDTNEPAADPGLVDGRLWVDSRPEKLTDYVNAAFFASAANLGVFERASSYDIRFELFDLTRDKKSMRVTFPQTNRSAEFRFRVRECQERKPFDLCLELGSNPWGGPTRYYGFTHPEDEAHALGPLAHRLRAAVDAQQRN